MILGEETARKLRVVLVACGLTHKAMAARLKVSRLTWWRILCGKRRVTAKERRLIAVALGLEPDAIFPQRRNVRAARRLSR